MPNILNFAVARLAASNRGLSDSESTRAGVLGSLQTNPIFALVIGRQVGSPPKPPASADPGTGGTADPDREPVTKGDLEPLVQSIQHLGEQVTGIDQRLQKVESTKQPKP